MRRFPTPAALAAAALLIVAPGHAPADDAPPAEPAPSVVAKEQPVAEAAAAAAADEDAEDLFDSEEEAQEDFMELVRALRTFPNAAEFPGDQAAYDAAAHPRAAEVAAMARDFAFTYPEHQMAQVAVDFFHRMVDSTGKSDDEKEAMRAAFLADARGTALEVTLSIRALMEDFDPTADAAPVVAALRELRGRTGGDPRVTTTLAEVAMYGSLETGARLALMEELSSDEAIDPMTRRRLEGAMTMLAAVGKPASFEFTSIDGRAIDTRSMKGRVVLVDFWATWCGPCVAEMPRLKETYATYHPQGLEVIGISLDDSLDDLKSYVAGEQIPWPQSFSDGEGGHPIANEWGITSIPTMFLIDKEGVLRSVNARSEMETLLPELLGEV